jgi:taurine dioxygenase
MKVTRLGQHIGAEVTGIDLRGPVDEAARRGLNAAVVENVALVVRDQDFTPEQYLAAVSLFGEPMEQHFHPVRAARLPARARGVEPAQGQDRQAVKHGAGWHTDHTNHRASAEVHVLLRGLRCRPPEATTAVVNMRAGYEALPETLKQKIQGMKTVNVFQGSASATYSGNQPTRRPSASPSPCCSRSCDESRQRTKALYFHPVKTENIVGMDRAGIAGAAERSLERSVREEFIYRHKWRKGDMLLWDNRAAMHRAHFDYDPSEYRLLYRVLVRGELPH